MKVSRKEISNIKKKKRYAISEDFNLKHLSFSIIYTVYIIKTTITDDK